jgi:DNA-binding beta-propeller fold protein YncE
MSRISIWAANAVSLASAALIGARLALGRSRSSVAGASTRSIPAARVLLISLGLTVLSLTVFGASQAAAAPTHRFLYQVLEPEPGRSFSEPCGVTTDAYGDIYVASRADSVIDVFDSAGNHLTAIKDGLAGKAVRDPCALAVDSEGFLYVKEEIGGGFSVGKVVLYEPEAFPPVAGTRYLAQRKVLEGEVGRNILGVAVNPANDHLYVDEQSRIVELASAGAGSATINDSIGEGILSFSYGVDVDAASAEVYATKSGGSGAVIVLNPSGSEALREVPAPSGSGLLQNIALDQESHDLLIFAPGSGIVHEFDQSGGEIPSAALGPDFGAGNSLEGAGSVDLTVDNGAFSPNKGTLYLLSGEGKPGALYAYGRLEEPRPSVVTKQASEATFHDSQIDATLNGSVDPENLEVKDCYFAYVSRQAFEDEGEASFEGGAAQQVPCEESAAEIGAGSDPVAVHAKVSDLTEAAYRYRLLAENENPPAAVGDVVGLGLPEISSVSANASFTEATLGASIDPGDLPTTYVVEYGRTSAYGQSTPVTAIPGGLAALPIAVALSGLQPGSTYHYRFVAKNELATAAGDDHSFATPSETPAGPCPNQALRSGPSINLPDCRAYELVTSAQMNGTAPVWVPSNNGGFPFSLASPEGERTVFTTEGTLPAQDGAGVFDAHLAERTSFGWSEHLVSPSARQSGAATPGGFSADLQYSLLAARGRAGSLDPEGGGYAQYLQLPAPTVGLCSPEPGSSFEYVGCGGLGSDPAALGDFLSPGAEHLIFSSKAHLEPEAPALGIEAIYDRRTDGITRVVSLLPGELTPSIDARYLGASGDGTAIAFEMGAGVDRALYVRTDNALTREIAEGEVSFAGLAGDGSSLFYVSGNDLRRVDLDSGAEATIAGGGEAKFVNVSADGQSAYFTSGLALSGAEANPAGEVASAGKDNLYRWQAKDGVTVFVAVLDHRDVSEFAGNHNYNLGRWTESQQPGLGGVAAGPATDPSRTNPDGSTLVFQSYAPLTGYDAEGHFEIFRYDASTGIIDCLSCPPNGAPAGADAILQDEAEGAPIQSANALIRNVSVDGATVFFQTAQALAPTDVNRVQDVYQWRSGAVSLISTGQSPQKSYLWAVDADGSDVFFATREALVGADEREGSASIYDARINGGFAESVPAQTCLGEACQGPPASSPAFALHPATLGLADTGKRPGRHRCPKKRHGASRGRKGDSKHQRSRGHRGKHNCHRRSHR